MKIKNLVDEEILWTVKTDNIGSSFSYLGWYLKYRSVDSNDYDSIGVKIKKAQQKNKKSPWVHLIILDNKEIIFNISKCKNLTITYKTSRNNSLNLYIKEKNFIHPDDLYYFNLPHSKDWKTVTIPIKDFKPPLRDSNRKIDLSETSGFIININFLSDDESTDSIFIKQFTMDEYVIMVFTFLRPCIKKESILSQIKYLSIIAIENLLLTIYYFLMRLKKAPIKYAKPLPDESPKNYGTAITQKKIWNKEYKKGLWNYLLRDFKKRTGLRIILRKYINNSKVLDLGCGFGNFFEFIGEEHFKKYMGVDISTIVIDKARKRHKNNEKCFFLADDIMSYNSEDKFDLIIFNEVIYYFNPDEIREMIKKYSFSLTSDGVLCFCIYNKLRYKMIVDLFQNEYKPVEIWHADSTPTCHKKNRNAIVLFLRE